MIKNLTHMQFREWRFRLDLTQGQAALALGYSRRQVQSYDSGEEPPRYIKLAMIALEEHPELVDDVIYHVRLKSRPEKAPKHERRARSRAA